MQLKGKLSMNKSEIIQEVAKRTGVPIAEAKKIVEATLDVISEHVILGENVKLSGFGTFGTKRSVGVARQRGMGKRHATARQQRRREHHVRVARKTEAVFSPSARLKKIEVSVSEKSGNPGETDDPGEFITRGKK